MASGHPTFAPKAAVNLGFVLFNDLHDAAGAREAFEVALQSGDQEQVGLAAMNLAAMDQLGLNAPRDRVMTRTMTASTSQRTATRR
jgi:hypothetical protein